MDFEDSSDETSSETGENLEDAELLGERIQIPQGLIERTDLFNEVISPATFNSLSSADKSHLLVSHCRIIIFLH